MSQAELFSEGPTKKQGPVECLGMTFENDEARRAYFIERLREKLQDPEFRNIEGFPIGEDEDILRLSDPPYYTACPNPFLPEVLTEWQEERQVLREHLGLPDQAMQREPFAADVSEGKSDPIYNAHSYHTKVPHKAIMRYILHYTDPGDVVFDGFCGTGMTGVAAQLCGDRKAMEELGYRVDNLGVIWDGNKAISHLGARKAVLIDLSPAATFIAYNYNTPVDTTAFEREAKRILREVEQECGWMYETWHPNYDDPKRVKGRINYTVWSEVFLCPECSKEVIFLDEALDEETQRVKEIFSCPHCGAEVSKRRLDKYRITEFDPATKSTHENLKRVPSLIEYVVGNKKYTKRADQYDLDLVQRIKELPLPHNFVIGEIPFMHMTHQRARMANYGVTNIHHFFFPRVQQTLGALWKKTNDIAEERIRKFILFTVEQNLWGMSLMNRYKPIQFGKPGGSQVNLYMPGFYYISSLISEVSPWYCMDGKVKRLSKTFSTLGVRRANSMILTESSTRESALEDVYDYIFTDPPFGENIYYADLNFLVEAWYGVKTNSKPEAIIDQAKKKRLIDYQKLMRQAFVLYYKALKPGHWMTVEFHNSHNAVWNAIQQALTEAGFVVADVRTLDKQSSSYRQVTAASAAKQDLAISAYKPNGNLEETFRLKAGSEEGVWEFIRYHLTKLPLVVEVDGTLEAVVERQHFLLFDRMIAFHVQREILVPLSAAEFYAGLSQRFPQRDGMYFLPDQVNAYDQARLRAHQVKQLELFVSDENSAILWLRQQLGSHPQTYQELYTKFLREISAWQKTEKPLELSEMLAENFLKYEVSGSIPEQIWNWMQQDDELHEAIKGQNRENPTKALIAVAKDRWFVPDPNNAQQLEKFREKELLKEFDTYKSYTGKKLKVFRLEAVRAGFKKAWHDTHYQTIIDVAEKISEEVLQEDPKLLMWYDQALTRMGR